jgi:hypothetical protein
LQRLERSLIVVVPQSPNAVTRDIAA